MRHAVRRRNSFPPANNDAPSHLLDQQLTRQPLQPIKDSPPSDHCDNISIIEQIDTPDIPLAKVPFDLKEPSSEHLEPFVSVLTEANLQYHTSSYPSCRQARHRYVEAFVESQIEILQLQAQLQHCRQAEIQSFVPVEDRQNGNDAHPNATAGRSNGKPLSKWLKSLSRWLGHEPHKESNTAPPTSTHSPLSPARPVSCTYGALPDAPRLSNAPRLPDARQQSIASLQNDNAAGAETPLVLAYPSGSRPLSRVNDTDIRRVPNKRARLRYSFHGGDASHYRRPTSLRFIPRLSSLLEVEADDKEFVALRYPKMKQQAHATTGSHPPHCFKDTNPRPTMTCPETIQSMTINQH